MPNISTHRGRAAVVTGSGCGIGAAIALEFARRGANVVCADLQQRSETVSSIGAAAIGVAADVADPDGWAAIARRGIVPNVIQRQSYEMSDATFVTFRDGLMVNYREYWNPAAFTAAMSGARF